MTARQRRLPLRWEAWADYYFNAGMREIERKIAAKKVMGTNKSDLAGIELEYDVWCLCAPLVKADIQIRYQYRINNGEHKADIFLRRVRRYGGRDVILSIKDQTGSGSHDKKITDDVEFARRCGLPIKAVVLGGNIGTSVQNYLAQRPDILIRFEDFPDWIQQIAEAQLLPDGVGIRVLKSERRL